jgi:hypothetical protein
MEEEERVRVRVRRGGGGRGSEGCGLRRGRDRWSWSGRVAERRAGTGRTRIGTDASSPAAGPRASEAAARTLYAGGLPALHVRQRPLGGRPLAGQRQVLREGQRVRPGAREAAAAA